MISDVTTSSSPLNPELGREVLFNCYQKNAGKIERNTLKVQIDKFKSDLIWFNNTCKGVLEDGMPFSYSYKDHTFVKAKNPTSLLDPLSAKRDCLVHKIQIFVTKILTFEEGYKLTDNKALEAYLHYKLLKHTSFSSINDFVENGSKEETEKAESTLYKLFGKIEKNTLLSAEEKPIAALSKTVIETPTTVETASDETPSSPIDSELPANSFNTTDELMPLLVKIESGLTKKKVHSAEGKGLKEGLLGELSKIKEWLLQDQDTHNLKLQHLFNSKVTNIVSDDLFSLIQQLGNALKLHTSGTIGEVTSQVEQAPLSEKSSSLIMNENPTVIETGTPTDVTTPPEKEPTFIPVQKEEEIVFSTDVKLEPEDAVNKEEEPKVETPKENQRHPERLSGWSKLWESVKNFFIQIGNWLSLIWQQLVS